MGKWYKWVWLACLTIFITGCWDRVEIEDRGFVIGAALDTSDKKKIKLTFQFVVPSALSGKGQTGSSGAKDAFMNLTTEGNSIFDAARQMSTQASRSPYLQHIKIIILSEDLVRKGELSMALDLFIRDHEMRRASKVMIADGTTARKIFEIKPTNEQLPVLYIDSTSENKAKSASILPPTSVGDVHSFLLGDHSFAIPKITALDQKVKVSGSAVFDGSNKKMKGFLNSRETMGLNFMTGVVKGGSIEFQMNDKMVVLELKQSKRTIHANVSNPEHIVFNVEVDVEGNVAETEARLDLLDEKVLREIEKKVAEEVEKRTTMITQRAQKKYKLDFMGMGRYLEQSHFNTWKSIKDDWDQGANLFLKSEIQVKANVKVRIIGSTIEIR